VPPMGSEGICSRPLKTLVEFAVQVTVTVLVVCAPVTDSESEIEMLAGE
jgi:hypothetical protein